MNTDQPCISVKASGHEEDGGRHHHPEYPGEDKVVPGPIPAVDEGVPEERDDEGERGTKHDFEEGFHTW